MTSRTTKANTPRTLIGALIGSLGSRLSPATASRIATPVQGLLRWLSPGSAPSEPSEPAPTAPSPTPAASSRAQGVPGSPDAENLPVPALPETAAASKLSWRDVEGSPDGWLKVLPGEQLLQLVQADRALQLMWRESRVSRITWDRDLRPALLGYAELVQLMPASESHHHAHVGGLLAHTIEMMLAAMTWRNGHFLPEGASVEAIDAQRDVWTYVVFFGALLHDVGKIMCDLRITWKASGMVDPLDWSAIAGPLTQVCAHLASSQYLVQFTPKASRDYQSHSRLALLLLQRVAPASSLTFLARHPAALAALSKYLSGEDRTGLVARIISRADQASTARALKDGSRARFTTSTSVPLVDLLMSALRDLLKSGSGLPLNRSGAAGWVYDGSLWLVAKRVADSVRKHLAERAPHESVPGENKNDRLFDTWQEYGCILPNPTTGQAIWYVTVQGGEVPAFDGAAAQPAQPSYSHGLSMLRFALDKIYSDPSEYPPAMVGRLEVKAARSATKGTGSTGTNGEQANGPDATVAHEGIEQAYAVSAEMAAAVADEQGTSIGASPAGESETLPTVPPAAAVRNDARRAPSAVDAPETTARTAPRKPAGDLAGVRAPLIGQPKPKGRTPPKSSPTAVDSSMSRGGPAQGPGTTQDATEAAGGPPMPTHGLKAPQAPLAPAASTCQLPPPSVAASQPAAPALPQSPDASEDDAEKVLPPVPHVGSGRHGSSKPGRSSRAPATPHPVAAEQLGETGTDELPAVERAARTTSRPSAQLGAGASVREAPHSAAPGATEPDAPGQQALEGSPSQQVSARPQDQGADEPAKSNVGDRPVVLAPFLPPLPHQQQAAVVPQAATEFIQWLQQGLASRQLPYNEAGAMVHFVPEGMALVSPAIFKAYAEARLGGQDPSAAGLQVQREVVKAGWHLVGPGRVNILSYDVLGRGAQPVSKLSVVVLTRPDRWVVPIPPSNPVLKRRLAAVDQ